MTIVLCPGLGLAAEAWAPVVELLPVGLPVILLDRPGLGALRREDPHPLTLAAEVARLVAALQSALGAPALFVGHSMAGFIVEAAARLHPQLTRGLLLVDGSVEESPRAVRPLRRQAHAALGAALRSFPRVPSVMTARALLAENSTYPQLAVDLAQVRAQHPVPDVPVSVLTAARRRWWPPDQSWVRRQEQLVQRLRADHPRHAVDHQVIWGSGHRVMTDAPQAVATAIQEVYAVR